MENYIVINGKRAELTEEQMKALGIEVKKDPFARACGVLYYEITGGGIVSVMNDTGHTYDERRFACANYCTDKALMEQRALHETLNRLLWRYSMQHDGEKIDWGSKFNWRIIYVHTYDEFRAYDNDDYQTIGAVYFVDKETALAAIEEVVKPFMEQHPEFKW